MNSLPNPTNPHSIAPANTPELEHGGNAVNKYSFNFRMQVFTVELEPQPLGKNEARGETKQETSGKRLLSPSFVLRVGPDQILMSAHEDVLCQSPVLRAMCTGNFKESKDGLIILNEDEPAIFALMIEYLYTGTYDHQHGNFDLGTRIKRADEEAIDLYIMADKYRLPGLQRVIISKLINGITQSNEMFFTSARRVYETLPTTKGFYFDYFRKYAPLYMIPNATTSQHWFESIINEGGPFAVEVVKIMTKMIQGPHMLTHRGTETRAFSHHANVTVGFRQLPAWLADFGVICPGGICTEAVGTSGAPLSNVRPA